MLPTRHAAIFIVLGLFSIGAYAAEGDFVVLTDNLPSWDLQLNDEQRAQREAIDKRNAALLARGRESALVGYRQVEADMKQHGYSLADDKRLSYYDETVSIARVTGPVSSIPFGYVPLDLNQPTYGDSTLKGINASIGDDGLVHRTQYIFALEDLGNILIDELSFATIPNKRIAVSRPYGNVSVNDYPASYVVFQNEERTKGLTQIIFITENKMFTLTTLRALLRSDDKNFPRLMEIAGSLR